MNEKIRSFNRDFDAIVNIHGERPVFIPVFDGQQTITYEQLNELVFRHFAWFDHLGLKRGDRIGALVPNSVEMLALFIACLRGGYGFAPLACDTTSNEAENWAKLIRPACVIVGNIIPEPVRKGLLVSSVICVEVKADGNFSHLPTNSQTVYCATGAKIFLFTSGTTGQPKAIVLDSDRLWSSGHAFLRMHGFNFNSNFRIWNYLPQSYLGGLFNLCLIPMTVAGSVVVDETFSGKTFLGYWQTIDRYDLTALWFVPTIIRGLLAIGEKTHRNEAKSYKEIIKIAFLGTSQIGLSEKRRFEEVFGIPLLENYALSETTFLTTETANSISVRCEGSVGGVLPNVEITFRPVEGGIAYEFQEILIKTPFIFDGYLNERGEVLGPFENGFFPTGDLGYLDNNGQLIITGRCKDIIKKGGQLVSLREIENLAMRSPFVESAAATVISHSFYGECYVLFVQLLQPIDVATEDVVRNYLYSTLAKYKWPEKIEFVDKFQYTGSGKIRKFLLRSKGDL